MNALKGTIAAISAALMLASQAILADENIIIGYFDCSVKASSLILPDDNGDIKSFSGWRNGVAVGDRIRATYEYDVIRDNYRFDVKDLIRDNKLISFTEFGVDNGSEKGARQFSLKGDHRFLKIHLPNFVNYHTFSHSSLELLTLVHGRMNISSENGLNWVGSISLINGANSTLTLGIKCTHAKTALDGILSHFSKVHMKHFGRPKP